MEQSIFRAIELSVKNKVPTIALATAIVLFGIWSWFDIQKEAYSDIADTQVRLVAKFPGRAAVEVEERVTLPIERVLNNTPQVIVRRSRTIFGLVVFQFVFEEGTDDYFARTRLLEKVKEADIPAEVVPSLAPMSSPSGEIFRYVIESAQNHAPMEVRTAQDWIVMPKLLGTPCIADVVTFGGLGKQYHVITTPEKLVQYKTNLEEVIGAIQANNLNTGGNILRQGDQGFPIRSLGAIRTIKDIENIVVKTENGVPIFVKNLSSVEVSPLLPSGILGYVTQDKSAGEPRVEVDSNVQGNVAMRRWCDPNKTGDAIKAKIQEINTTYMPQGMQIKQMYDRAEMVTYTLRTISKTLIEGVTIVALILIFFIGSVRTALVVVLTIPFSMLFAFILMKMTGLSANLLSLGAIDFGIIVDGAVVMAENIMRRYRDKHAHRHKGVDNFTIESSAEVGKEIFFSIAIIILAYIPIFSFQRIEGRLFKPMAFTISYAILGSMVFGLTMIPVMMSVIYRKYLQSDGNEKIEWHNPIYAWMEKVYARMMEWLIARYKKVLVVSFSLVTLLVGVGVWKIGTEFLPELDEGALNLRAYFPVGVSIQAANKTLPKIREVIYRNSQVKNMLSQLGRNDDGTDPLPPNRLEIQINLHDYDKWEESITKPQLLKRMTSELEAEFPGVRFSFSQPIMDNLAEAIMGTIADMAVFVSGPDLKIMRQKAEEILAIVAKMKGASEYGIEQEGDGPQLQITIDREACARYGINVSTIQRMIESGVGAEKSSTLYEGFMRFGIVVRFPYEYRKSVKALKNLPVFSPRGDRVPLSQLAKIELTDGPTMIFRQEGKRTVTVRTNIRDRDQGSFVAELQKKVAAQVKLPPGYTTQYGGNYENLARVGKQLAIAIPITVLIIFGLLFLMYRNLRFVFVALACLPLSMVGGLVALLMRGYYFNVSAGVGFISLFGIATMAGVLFVSRTNHILKQHPGMTIIEAVEKASIVQLRPMLMTMLLALLGLIPATLATGVGSDVQRPLATVIVGGLISALLLVLTVLPCLYLQIVEEKKEPQPIPELTPAQIENIESFLRGEGIEAPQPPVRRNPKRKRRGRFGGDT
ncbi:MAG: CusA/CzcA family heavy metal efflux RND transporter [Turneriella sp.]